MYFEGLHLGQVFLSSSREITQEGIRAFAELSGDHNPLHLDPEWVKKHTEFTSVIAHGLYVTSLGSGMPTPGLDDLQILAYLEANRRFTGPAYPGDNVHVKCVVEELKESRSNPAVGIVRMTVEILNQDDQVLQQGEDVYMVARRGVGEC